MKKRILSLALVLALCLGLAVPAMAAETTTETFEIGGLTFTISNVVKKVIQRVKVFERPTTVTFYVISDNGAEMRAKLSNGDSWDGEGFGHSTYVWESELQSLQGHGIGWEDNDYVAFDPYNEKEDRYFCEVFGTDDESFCVMYESAFADVVLIENKINAADWAQDTLEKAYNAGLFASTINPFEEDCTRGMTRSEFAAVVVNLYRALGGSLEGVSIYDGEPFTDVKWIIKRGFGHSYLGSTVPPKEETDTSAAPAVKVDVNVGYAYHLGFVTGTSATTFDPEGTLTREQAAVMLSRVYAKLHGDIPTVTATTFADNAAIGGWAKSAVAFMADKGIMGGVGNNVFAPQQVLSIQEAMVMAQRMLENL